MESPKRGLFAEELKNLVQRVGEIGDQCDQDLLEAFITNDPEDSDSVSFDELDLDDNDAELIAYVLTFNTECKSLSLSRNIIGNEGAAKLAESLKYNKSLNTLTLHYNVIGRPGVLALASAVKFRPDFRLFVAHQATEEITVRNTAAWGELTEVHLIGSGNFGSAYEAKYDESMVDMDELSHDIGVADAVVKVTHDKRSPDALYESLILTCIPEHDNVLKLFGFKRGFLHNEEHLPALIVQKHKLGSLENFIDKSRDIVYDELYLELCVGMTRAIEHLHKFSIIHRDSALRNFVMHDEFRPVLIDFGLSIYLGEGSESIQDRAPIPLTSAPECFSDHLHSISSDVWLLGTTFAELMGAPMFIEENHQEFVRSCKNCPTKLFPWNSCEFRNGELKQLILRCCSFERLDRPSVEEMLIQLQGIISTMLAEKNEEKTDKCIGMEMVVSNMDGKSFDLSVYYQRTAEKIGLYCDEFGRIVDGRSDADEPEIVLQYFDEFGNPVDESKSVGVQTDEVPQTEPSSSAGGYFDESGNSLMARESVYDENNNTGCE